MSGFIVLEGPDGAGTTLHSKLLAERLTSAGKTVCLTAEPSDGAIGTWIREELKKGSMPANALQLAFCADRADHIQKVIAPALARGDVVICDRYAMSTVVYGSIFGVDRSWLKSINHGFLKPSLTFVVLPPIEVALERLQRRSSHDAFEKEDLQRKIHEAYRHELNEDSSLLHIDSSGSKEAVAAVIWEKVMETIPASDSI